MNAPTAILTPEAEVTAGDLAVLNEKTKVALLTDEKAFEDLLDKIRTEVRSHVPDVTTDKGRKAIASLAHKVTKTKTALDEAGKSLTEDLRKQVKTVDDSRRKIREKLDELRDEARKPLTDWEAEEDERIERIKSSMSELQGVIDDQSDRSSEIIRERLGEVEREAITEQFYAEFTGAAAELKDKAIAALRVALERAQKREAEQVELARLRAAEAERKQKERDDQIAREAAERAKRDAEAKAEAARKAAEDATRREREAAERRELELKLQAEQAERRAAEAEAKAKREAEQKATAEKAEAARREADKAHRATINKAALDALVADGIAKDTAKAVITLIAKKGVPHVSINY